MTGNTVFPMLVGTLGVMVSILVARKWIGRFKKGLQIPGPLGWPVLGYMPYLHPSALHSTMENLKNKYGPIFQIPLGSYNTVVISDYHLIKKAFRNAELSDRPKMYLFEFASEGFHGIASSTGEIWNEQRRFALRHLRDLGMDKTSIQYHVQREALNMVQLLSKSVGQPIDLNSSLNIAITNIVWSIVAGSRMEYDDPMFIGFMAALRHNMEVGASMGIVGFIPWLKDILPRSWTGVDLMEESVKTIYGYFKNIIADHKATFDPDNMSDYTDYFIDEQIRQGENSTFTDKQLIVSMADLFIAGGETTATTLRWAVLLLAYHSDVQRKLHDEIDSTVGKDRRPEIDDRERMPYTVAVIHEIQRFADVLPMGVFHACTEDFQFEDYTIPKDTVVMGYVGGIHRSKEFWMKPNEFYPEHFLNENGSLRKNVEGFLPFSTGKRACIGENLARVELFVFITYFFQKFEFVLCENPKVSLHGDPKGGIFRWPSPYRVVLKFR